MGFGLRFREKVKQTGKKDGQPDKNGFVATSYERVQLTYDEAVKFGENLKIVRKRLVDVHAVRAKLYKDVEGILTGPLPAVHQIDPVTGEHTTSEAAPPGAANHVHQGTLTRISEETEAKAQTQVFQPLDRFASEVDLFKGKMKILENLRLELDGSRRQHIQLENKIAKAEAKSTEVDPKHAQHIQSKDASVAGKRTAFEQYEAQLYEDLTGLIAQAGVLHDSLDRALQLEIEAFQRGLSPISAATTGLGQGVAGGVTGGVAPMGVAGAGVTAPSAAVPAHTGAAAGVPASVPGGAPMPSVPTGGAGAYAGKPAAVAPVAAPATPQAAPKASLA